MDREPGASSHTPLPQVIARLALTTALVAAGIWILWDFIPALVWAAIFAIVLWPLRRRLVQVLPARGERELAPLLLVVAVGLIFILPLVLLGFALAREGHVVVHFVGHARGNGVPLPEWIARLPLVGAPLAGWWQDNLSNPGVVQDLLGRLNPKLLAESARHFGAEIVHRLVLFSFTLLTLFFLFRDGDRLAAQARILGDRLFGHHGERIAFQMIAAVHGTVTGLVLVGLAEGVVLGFVYLAVGLPDPASVGALTGVAAVIPFGSPAVFCLAALYLAAQDNMGAAIIVLASGSFVVFIADHLIRPVLIGGAARLPFLWVLLGILGGLEALGILGLFVGPAIMAALLALWREGTEHPRRPVPARPAATRPAAAPPQPNGRRTGGRKG